MNEIIILSEESLKEYRQMLPGWLLESAADGSGVEFWGLRCFGIPAGVAATKDGFQEKSLLYLYIDPEYRCAGRGRKFLSELMLRTYRDGYKYFSTGYMEGQFQEFESILRIYPFQRETQELASVCCTLGELLELPQFQGEYRNIRPLSSCSQESLKLLYQEIRERGMELVELPLDKKKYIADCCAVCWEKDKPKGILLVEEQEEGSCRVPFIVSFSSNILAPVEMMRFSIQTAGKCYPPETVCKFAVINPALLQLLEKLGIKTAFKRVKRTLELSYFEQYELAARLKIFEEQMGMKRERI